jgi:type II secretory ATPase GspE/PulE/Tfp pilus assembly ATPase PilB-like protein
MSQMLQQDFLLPDLPSDDSNYVPELVDRLLESALNGRVSDVHLTPTAESLIMQWRIDGVLQDVAKFPKEIAAQIVSRLKVLARLLTYQSDVPQEGRIQDDRFENEIRVSTFPTIFGERAVVRLFIGQQEFHELADLDFPEDISVALSSLMNETGGCLIVTGPSGSGKTTTIYSCLREILNKSAGGRSLVSLEDPVEVVVPGMAQSRVNPAAGFDYQTGLKSLMRQDPDVIMVGEIRDSETAQTVFQASMTGHLVITTFHAGSAAEAICRVGDIGVEPYILQSGLLGIVAQRLVRKLCECKLAVACSEIESEFQTEKIWQPKGCDRCSGTGYFGRQVLAELLVPERDSFQKEILSRSDSQEIAQLAIQAGMVPLKERARQAVVSGLTSPQEIHRVFGVQRN